ncbi:hypothetical protein SASPL_114949 [Salvia splendens]|uniref:DUF7792 domain-containing protein n=1 Tax=Salvia splendens TaxID=180675 RepID=A0A8X8Y7F5_SALSN|nr:uncharacterized protein LOC121803976 [Salvia splendens]KAG6424531.1 hypothetical protein SASPL_114949 [Salvia splendens]
MVFVFQENLNSVILCDEEKSIQEVLSFLIVLAERVITAAQEAGSFTPGNLRISGQVTDICKLLRPLARLSATTAPAVYDRPIRRVCQGLTKALDRALTFARRCRNEKTSFLHQILSINIAADFKKVTSSLDSFLADLRWLLAIYNRDTFDVGTLSPIATTDPILAYVWPAIASLHMGRGEGAAQLADCTNMNERTKNVIVDEVGIPPLLKMLCGCGSVDAYGPAATALYNLADDRFRVAVIRDAGGIGAIVKAMAKGPPARVQLVLVELVLRMLEMSDDVQEEFGAEDLAMHLVALLSVDVDLDEFLDLNYLKSSSVGEECVRSDKEREREKEVVVPPEVKCRLKINCAIALWKLARRSLVNSRNITDTRALLVLEKIIKKEQGELKKNCLKVVAELAEVAESNSDLKRTAFKLTSTPAKAVLEQLLKVMSEERNANMVTLAVKAVGCLASMFSAKEKRVVRCLVAKLGHLDRGVADEAARSLSKFVCIRNYNRKEHAEAIIEYDGVPMLMNLLRNDRGHFHLQLDMLVLLSNLAVNACSTRVLEEAWVLRALEDAAKNVVSLRPDLKELFANAIHQLVIYQVGVVPNAETWEA